MNAPAIDPEQYRERIDALGLTPRVDVLTNLVGSWMSNGKFQRQLDASTAPIAVQALQFVYARVYEESYGNLKAAMGQVLPFDTSPNPAHDTYKYKYLDWAGYADWIGDDGSVMGEGSMKMTEHIGFMAELGHAYSWTVFDLERAALDGQNLSAIPPRIARRVHEMFHNWVWLFGDPDKQIHGLFTHPNIQVVLAPDSAAGTYPDARAKLIEGKSVDEILADIETLVETVPRTTNEELRVRKVFMSERDMAVMKRKRVGAGDGVLTIWQMVQSLYPDVEFDTLPECEESKRVDPRTGTNTSNLTGRCWIAVPDLPADECGFVFPRPFTQRAPQEIDLKIRTITHSKIGGFKCTQPLGVVRMDFLAQTVDIVPT